MSLNVGDKAPAFEGVDQDGNPLDKIYTDVIEMTITDEEGSTTTITIPIGTGGF